MAPDQQLQNAMDQHQGLASCWGLGVPGTIYKEFYDTMDLLGVGKAEAKRCAA